MSRKKKVIIIESGVAGPVQDVTVFPQPARAEVSMVGIDYDDVEVDDETAEAMLEAAASYPEG